MIAASFLSYPINSVDFRCNWPQDEETRQKVQNTKNISLSRFVVEKSSRNFLTSTISESMKELSRFVMSLENLGRFEAHLSRHGSKSDEKRSKISEKSWIFKFLSIEKLSKNSLFPDRSQTVNDNRLTSSKKSLCEIWNCFQYIGLQKKKSKKLNFRTFFAEKIYRERLTLKRKQTILYRKSSIKPK